MPDSGRTWIPVRFLQRALAAALLSVALAGCAAERILYDQPSRYSRIFVVEDPAGLRTLYFDNRRARQSVVKPGDPDHVELPYARAAMVALAIRELPRRILVVGLGGGTLPMFLRRHLPEAEIDAVDIDPDVVAVAKRFFGFREDVRLRAHVDDGRRFIERAPESHYDIVFLDAFGSESVPEHLTTQEFLQSVRRALAPDGVVVGNVWSRNHNALYDAMLRTYQEVFADLYRVVVGGDVNHMFFALRQRRDLRQADVAARARALALGKKFRFDPGAMVEASFSRAIDRDPQASVLRDPAANRAR